MGYIYIFTNPSFPQYVKIGYAADVKQRLEDLNRSTAVPFAFRVFATYEVDSVLSDTKIHSILDKLNPSLRSKEEIGGKMRIREFYAMTPDDAYSILEAIAEINGFSERLRKWNASEEEKRDEDIANEIIEEHREKAKAFSFKMCNIQNGEKIEFVCHGNKYNGTKVTVIDEKHVEYDNDIWTLTSLAKFFLNKTDTHLAGPKYFKYNGEWLNSIRKDNQF